MRRILKLLWRMSTCIRNPDKCDRCLQFVQSIYQMTDDSRSEYCAGVFFSCRPCPRALTLLEIIRDGVYNAGRISSDPDSHSDGVHVQPLLRSTAPSTNLETIKTKITMQCNQRCIWCSFRLKHSPRLPVKTIVLPRADSATEIASRLPNAKRAMTFEDRDRLRKIRGTRLSVAYTSAVSLRLCARMHVTYSFEYQKFDVCQKRKLLLFFVIASGQKILRKIVGVIESNLIVSGVKLKINSWAVKNIHNK